MKLIIDVDEKIVCKGFEQPLTEEERMTLIRAIGNGIPYNPTGSLTEAEKKICKMYLEDLDKWHTCNEYKLLMSLIDSAPTVEPERPQGEWVCHNCGADNKDEMHFCWYCGANRKGGEQENDNKV